MTTDDMDADLSKYSDFEQLSNRVSYWRRRLGLTEDRDQMAEAFDAVVAKHSRRVLGVLRAG